MMLDPIITPVKDRSTTLRSIRPVTEAMQRLVSTAKMPDAEIACPALPSVMTKSVAIGVSKLIGMNSDAISTNTHSAMAKTGPHAADRAPAELLTEDC